MDFLPSNRRYFPDPDDRDDLDRKVTLIATGEVLDLMAVEGDKVICWGGSHDPWKPHFMTRAAGDQTQPS